MTDLTTRYLGLELRSPIVASASPLNGHPDTARQVEDAGAAAIVLPSLFEEEILAEEMQLNGALEAGTEHLAEALGYFPAIDTFAGAGDRYLATLERIKAPVGDPGDRQPQRHHGAGGWVRYAELLQEAGADAVELNLYHLAVDPDRTAADMEAADLELVAAVRARLGVPAGGEAQPLLLGHGQLRPDGSSTPAPTGSCCSTASTNPTSTSTRSTSWPGSSSADPAELRLPLRWIAILRPAARPDVSLAATVRGPLRHRRGQGAHGRAPTWP